MTPLIITEEVRAACRRLAEYADAHRLRAIDIHRLSTQPGACIGDDLNLRLVIPFGFRVVFSIEELEDLRTHTFHWFRHLSVSMATPGRVPIPLSVHMIAAELGFDQSGTAERQMFLQPIIATDGTPADAVNLVEKI